MEKKTKKRAGPLVPRALYVAGRPTRLALALPVIVTGVLTLLVMMKF
ncbi:hypothetical protein [Paenibacillus periandrae]|nr:hypothetical protein [Paenibacillus periandrae]